MEGQSFLVKNVWFLRILLGSSTGKHLDRHVEIIAKVILLGARHKKRGGTNIRSVRFELHLENILYFLKFIANIY